jgi:hypothetical protein
MVYKNSKPKFSEEVLQKFFNFEKFFKFFKAISSGEKKKTRRVSMYDFYIVKTFLSFLVLHNYLDKKFYFIISNEFEQINMQLHGWKKYLKGIKNEN